MTRCSSGHQVVRPHSVERYTGAILPSGTSTTFFPHMAQLSGILEGLDPCRSPENKRRCTRETHETDGSAVVWVPSQAILVGALRAVDLAFHFRHSRVWSVTYMLEPCQTGPRYALLVQGTLAILALHIGVPLALSDPVMKAAPCSNSCRSCAL